MKKIGLIIEPSLVAPRTWRLEVEREATLRRRRILSQVLIVVFQNCAIYFRHFFSLLLGGL